MSSMKLMSKQRAMETYALTANDLATLRSARGKNPYSRQMYTVLYLIDDVEEKAIEKHGSKEKILKKIGEREARKNEKYEKKKADKSRRRAELSAQMYKLGLGLIRSDSVLCNDYIEKGPECGFTVDEICQILKEMDFYYKHTDYRNHLRQVRADNRELYGWHCTDENEVRDEAKEVALREFVKKNYRNHHAMVLALPESLKAKAFEISEALYKKHGASDGNMNMQQQQGEKQQQQQQQELPNEPGMVALDVPVIHNQNNAVDNGKDKYLKDMERTILEHKKQVSAYKKTIRNNHIRA